MDPRQLQAPVSKPSRLSYQERQVSPERSQERERPNTSGQSRDREQLKLSQQPENDSTMQNIVRPKRTDDYIITHTLDIDRLNDKIRRLSFIAAEVFIFTCELRYQEYSDNFEAKVAPEHQSEQLRQEERL
jgi:hypothetical protein